MRAWAWLTGNLLTVAVIAIAAFLIITNVQSCRDKGDSQFDAVMVERIRVDSIRAVADSIALADANRRLDAAIANAGKGADRWREVKVPVYLPANASASDTIRSLAKRLNSCYEAGDSLAASIVPIQSACTSYRDTATKAIANLREGIARRDSLLERRVVEKRVQYLGVLLYELPKNRPVVGVGVSTKLFWKLDGKVDVQYAIPKAVKDTAAGNRLTDAEKGDGFRVLAGAQLKF